MPTEVHADHVEPCPREAVQKLLVELRMGHGPGKKTTHGAALAPPKGQGYGRPGRPDQGLFVHIGSLDDVEQALRSSSHVLLAWIASAPWTPRLKRTFAWIVGSTISSACGQTGSRR